MVTENCKKIEPVVEQLRSETKYTTFSEHGVYPWFYTIFLPLLLLCYSLHDLFDFIIIQLYGTE